MPFGLDGWALPLLVLVLDRGWFVVVGVVEEDAGDGEVVVLVDDEEIWEVVPLETREVMLIASSVGVVEDGPAEEEEEEGLEGLE